MRSFFENKTWVLLVSILALGALTVLSVSLKNVSFKDAQPIGRGEAEPFVSPPSVVAEPQGEVSVWTQVMLWIVLTILVCLIALLLSPEGRRRMFRILIRLVASYLAVYFLFKRYPEIFSNLLFNFDALAGGRPADNVVDLPPPVFTPPQPSPFVSYVISVFIVLVMMYLGWTLYRAWKKLSASTQQQPLSEIAQIARSSLRELSSGRESTDVIMNCYFRMSDVVGSKKNMQRRPAMTPAEFATRLEDSGLPSDAVRRLTRLFESVRYGSHKTGQKEINEAVACLTTILQYCGEPV